MPNNTTQLPLLPNHLDLPALESWLWEAACVIRGPVDAPKFKDYILPLIFLKRVSDVFEDEISRLSRVRHPAERPSSWPKPTTAGPLLHPRTKARWAEVAKQTNGVGEYLTDAVRAVARVNPRLQGVIDITDFNATTSGQRILDDEHLACPRPNAQPAPAGTGGRGEGHPRPSLRVSAAQVCRRPGQSAGEFYTAAKVALLMALILDPQPGQSVYDSNCGTAGLLIKAATCA